MARSLRVADGSIAYHVLNRGVGRTIFERDGDYGAFLRVIYDVQLRIALRVIVTAWCRTTTTLFSGRGASASCRSSFGSSVSRALSGFRPPPAPAARARSIRGGSRASHSRTARTACRYVERNTLRARLASSARRGRSAARTAAAVHTTRRFQCEDLKR